MLEAKGRSVRNKMTSTMAVLTFMVSFFLLAPPAYGERQGFRATMIRRTDTTASLRQAARHSHQRLSLLASRLASQGNAETPMRMEIGGGGYDMELSIGTPPQKLTALADTGSNLVWVKCGECTSCTPHGLSYYPNASSTFSKLPCSHPLCDAVLSEFYGANCSDSGAECDYRAAYGDVSDLYGQGFLGSETFTLGGGNDAVPSVGFGCTNMSEGNFGTSSGLVGLGRGPLSLVSQLNAGTFSYCLASNASKPSPLLFGSVANLTGSGPGVQSTPLLPSGIFYEVNLQSISIGSTTTPGDNGIVFDSGTTLTFLAEPAYTQAKAEVLSQVKNLTRAADREGFEACYEKPGEGSVVVMEEAVPSMVLHFDGGADMVLPVANYFSEVDDGVVCWIVQRSTTLSIVGNVMQMDFHVLHDLEKSLLSFQPANCDTL